jgi:hypothetical protein
MDEKLLLSCGKISFKNFLKHFLKLSVLTLLISDKITCFSLTVYGMTVRFLAEFDDDRNKIKLSAICQILTRFDALQYNK